MDGLKYLPQAIKTVFPEVNIKTCIIHQTNRNSIKYIASKDKKEFMRNLKEVYKATTEDFGFSWHNEAIFTMISFKRFLKESLITLYF